MAVNPNDPFGLANLPGAPGNVPNGNQGNNNQFAGVQGNGQQALAQIFQQMMNAGPMANTPSSMAYGDVASAYNGMPGAMNNAMGQMGAVNSANQNASMGLQGMQTQLDAQRFGNEAALTRQAMNRPLLQGLIQGVAGGLGTGGLSGFQSTNSPQAAGLPASAMGNPANASLVNKDLTSNWQSAMAGLPGGGLDWMQSPQALARTNQMANYNAALHGPNALAPSENPGGVNPMIVGSNVLS